MTDDAMVPDKIMIYDSDGQMAGIQSLVPSEDFVGMDCTENKYYLKDTINSKEVSMKALKRHALTSKKKCTHLGNSKGKRKWQK